MVKIRDGPTAYLNDLLVRRKNALAEVSNAVRREHFEEGKVTQLESQVG